MVLGAAGALRSIFRRPEIVQKSISAACLSFGHCHQSPFSRLGSALQGGPGFAAPAFVAWVPPSMRREVHSLTDPWFPKRRPGFKPRRKRASLNPPGPYKWLQYVPGEPMPRSRPNEGSVQGRNRIKRIKQRKAFIADERRKRKAEMQASKGKKRMERVERKIAAVARDRAWVERLAELQKLEKEKKMAA